MRVLLAAPSAMARAGLEGVLRGDPAIEVVGAIPLSSLMEEVISLQPDVLIVEGESSAVLDPALLHNEAMGVILISDEDPSTALHRGVRGVLPREASPEEVVGALRAAAAGLLVLYPAALQAMMPALTATAPSDMIESLTPREIEVLGMMAEGAGNKEIAHRLGISEHTVKFHVGSILSKMGVASRTEAVTVGIRRGFVLL